MKKSKLDLILMIVFTVLALAINAYIIYHSCLNGAQSSQASQGVVEVSEEVVNTVRPGTVTPENYNAFATFIRKSLGHFGLFVVSGIFSSISIYYIFKDFKWIKHFLNTIFALSFGLIIAMTTEIIQLNVPDRSGEFTDVLIDYSGYLLGAFLVGLVLFLVIRHQRKKQDNS